MTDTSEPLLRMLRELMQKRGLNTAAVAANADLDRHRLRRVLKGSEPMTVDELLRIGQALNLSPEDLGLPTDADFPDKPSEPVEVVEAPDDALGVDPWGNHAEQLFQVGFALGCDFLFLADVTLLEGSGVPQAVLSQFAERELPIKLDATYHRYNDPHYTPNGITLTLSFDQLCECKFPWAAIKQVMFFPAPAEPPGEEEETPEERPVLRLIT